MSPDLLAGRYELTERIAGGGMGQVWRGRDRVLERIVAIKTVDLAAAEATARERFRREAIATAGLSAPNIVQIYDAGVDGNTAYLVMELLAGPTLSQIIHDTGRMDINQGIHVALEVALALQTAHRIGIVHRDIKPGNVMYHHDQVKLVDFGIAQLARNLGAALTAPATALGTAAYMSPEQAAGEGATDKSDWYALGCL
ncbi:MAG: serine/threonine-protein kinase, partial [Propionibacteriaceae bacterium]|nr:serine/threonine-protein kinase [Propionibacteriaceae bacterium]